MRYAVIKNGAVVNIIQADEGFEIKDHQLVQSDDAQIGWLYDNGFIEPQKPAIIALAPPSPEEQLKAIWAEFEARKDKGDKLTPEADAMLAKIKGV